MKIEIRDITNEELKRIMGDDDIELSQPYLKRLNKLVGEFLEDTCVDSWFNVVEDGVKIITKSSFPWSYLNEISMETPIKLSKEENRK